MSNEEFLEHFGHFVDAPNGIQKLRELILQLAVQGRLVEQDENDEPVDVLLKKSKTAQKELVDSGVVKKGKAYPVISKDEIPYVIPDSWRWVRINEIGHNWGQKVPDNDFTYIDVSAINKEAGIIHEPNILTAKEAPSRARKIVKYGTVIYSTVRPYLLNIAVIEKEFDPKPIASTAFAIIHPFCGINARYIYSYLRSPAFIQYVESVQTGIAYPAINDKQFFSGLFPLPPLAEQHRIVAKVDELMALCDQLDAERNAREETHQRLICAVHHPLTGAGDTATTQKAWHRIRDNFANLYTTLESVQALRQTILQLAVQGKLVPQDSNDEPVAKLITRIDEQQLEHISAGKTKRYKYPTENPDELGLFSIPGSWVWKYLAELLIFGPRNGYSPKSVEYPTNVKSLTLTAITRGFFDRSQYKYLDIEVESDSYLWLRQGDILMQRANSLNYVGVSAIFDGDEEEYIYPDLIMKMRPSSEISEKYLILVLSSSYARDFMRERTTGTSGNMPKINQQTVNSIPIPLPPLAEQNRIATKVDELMALCDQLETHIRDKNDIATNYTEAVVHQIAVA